METGHGCILCGGPLARTSSADGYHWEGRVFAYRRCRRCLSRIIEPVPSLRDLARMYRHDDYHEAYYEESAQTEWPPSLRPARKGLRLLDFGCGNGAFLIEAARIGFEAVGVEPDPDTRAVAQQNSGCPVLSIEEVISSEQHFDVIHLGDVLEHLPNPAGTLRQLETLLNRDGVFFIEGPLEENASLVRLSNKLFTRLKWAAGQSSLAELPPLHLSRTSATSQRRFFEQAMHYELRLFEVSETGWPYLLPDSPAAVDGMTRARRMIGYAAVSLARIGRRFGLRLGNRFVAIATPVKQGGEVGVGSPLG
jgi:SAM-dependent methyltransferase